MRHILKLTVGAVALMASLPASAATFTFSFTPSQALFGTPFSGSGTFTTSNTAMTVNGQTAFAITGITGTINGSAINNVSGPSYGNYFTTGGFFLDGSGVNITTANGRSLNLFNQSNNNLYRVNSTSPGSSFYVNASSAAATGAVPEPATWAMMMLGLGGMGYAMRRRAKVSTRVRFA